MSIKKNMFKKSMYVTSTGFLVGCTTTTSSSGVTNFFPITVIVAIAIFVLKEVIEAIRRRRAEQRKINALKELLARECELNYWTIKSFTRIAEALKAEGEVEPPAERCTFKAVLKPGGKLFFQTIHADGEPGGESWIPEVYREVFSKHLLEIATLDSKFYELAAKSYDSLAEVQHVRDHIQDREVTLGFIEQESYDAGLGEYALDELSDAKGALDQLYRFCTGNELTNFRLR